MFYKGYHTSHGLLYGLYTYMSIFWCETHLAKMCTIENTKFNFRLLLVMTLWRYNSQKRYSILSIKTKVFHFLSLPQVHAKAKHKEHLSSNIVFNVHVLQNCGSFSHVSHTWVAFVLFLVKRTAHGWGDCNVLTFELMGNCYL
jgi:alpha-glucuronidase